jgi:hypothetical protein
MGTKELPAAISSSLSALLTARVFASGGQLHLVFVERATTDTANHAGKGDDNAGDILTSSCKLPDQKERRQVGLDQGYCIREAPGKACECPWTLTTAQGQIMVEEPFIDS